MRNVIEPIVTKFSNDILTFTVEFVDATNSCIHSGLLQLLEQLYPQIPEREKLMNLLEQLGDKPVIRRLKFLESVSTGARAIVDCSLWWYQDTNLTRHGGCLSKTSGRSGASARS